MIVWRDGGFLSADGAISATDRGWLIGDAIFETMLIEQGVPAFLDAHLARLSRGCALMKFDIDIDARRVRAAIADLTVKNGSPPRAACRLTLSRVGGPRGLAPAPASRVQTTIALHPAPGVPSTWRLIVSERRRWSGASTNGFKCVGAYAENMLARADAAAAGANDAIMLNEHGRVVSLSAANIFIVINDCILTPAENEGALPGVVRSVLLEEAPRLGLRIEESRLDIGTLTEGIILATNSIVGVVCCTLDRTTPEGAAAAGVLIDAYDSRLGAEFSGGVH